MRDTVGEALREDLATLVEAERLIRDEGWTQGSYVRTELQTRCVPIEYCRQGGVVRAFRGVVSEEIVAGRCMLGALVKAMTGAEMRTHFPLPYSLNRVRARLEIWMMRAFPGPWSLILHRFNDSPTTTKEHVLALFALTIRHLRKELEDHESTLAFNAEDHRGVHAGGTVQSDGSGEHGAGTHEVTRGRGRGRNHQRRGEGVQAIASDAPQRSREAAHASHGQPRRAPSSEVSAAHEEEDIGALVAA